jgi:ribosome maturation factor RimP
VNPTRDEVLDRLRHATRRIAASYGLELFDVQIRREAIGWVLRVIIDRPAPVADTTAPGDELPDVQMEVPIGIEDCQHVSQDLSALLDVDDSLTEGLNEFTLEVSSPGLDRPLRDEADYRRFRGRLAKIVTSEPIGGQSHFTGRLDGVDAGTVLVREGRRTHRVPIDRISRARLEVEF